MTVAMLMARLSKCNPNVEVMVLDGFNGGGYKREVNFGPVGQEITSPVGVRSMKYEYSIYHNFWCGWQLWRGPAGLFGSHTELVRRLLPESVRMMQRCGMLRRVGLSDALQVSMPGNKQ